jgi:hypothetical protein
MRKIHVALKQALAMSILLTAAASFSAAAPLLSKASVAKADGGTSGGGGTLIYSTKDEVKQVLNSIRPAGVREDKNLTLDAALSNLVSASSEIKEPTVKKIIKDFSRLPRAGDTYTVLDHVLNYLEIQAVDGPCHDRYNQVRAASVKEFYFGRGFPKSLTDIAEGYDDGFKGTICISITEFQKIPKDNLRQNMIALLAHEVSHIFGYDEVAAVKLQKYLMGEGFGYASGNTDEVTYAQNGILDVDTTVDKLRAALAGRRDNMEICARLGELVTKQNTFSEHLAESTTETDATRAVSDEALTEGDQLVLDILPLYGFCGITDLKYAGNTKYSAFRRLEYMNKGDRTELNNRLYALAKKIRKVEDLLKLKSDQVKQWKELTKLAEEYANKE